MNTPCLPSLLACALALACPSLHAALVYYLPFDDGSAASLASFGTNTGTATAVTGISNAPAPTASQVQVAPNLGSTWSELYTSPAPTEASNRGGAVVLPGSTTAFRLDSTTSRNQMTLSTWVYWNGNDGGTITSAAGIASTLNGSNTAGWSLRINNDGKVYFGWLNPAGNGRNRTTSSSVITAGQWVNVTLAFDSNIAQPASIYINGVSVSTAGSSGDVTMGAMKSDANSIALGIGNHTSGVGRLSLNGYMDDFSLWSTALSAAQIKSLNTAPALLTGYNAGIMADLFDTYAAQGSSIAGSLTWAYATGFDVTGRALGETWLGMDGKYYLWFEGAGAGAAGLMGVTNIPEPGSAAFLAGGILAVSVVFRRRPRNRR